MEDKNPENCSVQRLMCVDCPPVKVPPAPLMRGRAPEALQRKVGSSPIVHPSEHPSFTVRVQGDSHSFASLGMDDNSHFRHQTLDSGPFVVLSVSFFFSGSVFVSGTFLASISCLLRIIYTVAKHRKAPTSKKNWRPRYLWCGNTISQGRKGFAVCTKHQNPTSPGTQKTMSMGMGCSGRAGPTQLQAGIHKKDGKKKRNSHQTLLFGIALTDHISW